MPLAFGNDGLRVVGVANENQHTDIVRTLVGMGCEIGNELLIVALIGFLVLADVWA